MGLESLLARLEGHKQEVQPLEHLEHQGTREVFHEKPMQNKPGTPDTPRTPEIQQGWPDISTPAPRLPPLSRASKARRRKVLAMPARDGVRYALLVEDPNTDPVVMTVATPDGTREVLIPRDQYDPFEVLAKMGRWDTGRAGT